MIKGSNQFKTFMHNSIGLNGFKDIPFIPEMQIKEALPLI